MMLFMFLPLLFAWICFSHAWKNCWHSADDYRLFCGDLGNEVNDDVLSKAFSRFPSFNMARVSLYFPQVLYFFLLGTLLLDIVCLVYCCFLHILFTTFLSSVQSSWNLCAFKVDFSLVYTFVRCLNSYRNLKDAQYGESWISNITRCSLLFCSQWLIL